MPKKRPLTTDSKQRIADYIRETHIHGLTVRSFLAGHFKKEKDIRKRWDALLKEMSLIEKEISN